MKGISEMNEHWGERRLSDEEWNAALKEQYSRDSDDDDFGLSGLTALRAAAKKAEKIVTISLTDFMAEYVPPTFLVKGVLQKGHIGTITAQPNRGKTSVAVALAYAVASGADFCGHRVTQGKVLYLSGENPDDVRARFMGNAQFFPKEAKENIRVIAGVFDILGSMDSFFAKAEEDGGYDLVIVDTFAAYFQGEDENSNTQAKIFAQGLRKLTDLLGKPAVLIPAHPAKSADFSEELVPRGGSAILAEIDFNMTIRKKDNVIELGHNKVRGANFLPMRMMLVSAGDPRLVDIEGNPVPTVAARPIAPDVAKEIREKSITSKDAVLAYVAEHPLADREVMIADLLLQTGRSKTVIYDGIRSLTNEKYVTSTRNKQLEITAKGRKWLMGTAVATVQTDEIESDPAPEREEEN